MRTQEDLIPVPPTPRKGYKEYYIHDKKKWIQVRNNLNKTNPITLRNIKN